MGEQQIYLFKEDYDAMDAVPPVYKQEPTTTICTSMELQAGDLLQWYTTKRDNHKEHQWYRIQKVSSVKRIEAAQLRPLRHELVVAAVDTPAGEQLAEFQALQATELTREEQ